MLPGNIEPLPENVTPLNDERRKQLLANRAARGVAPKPDTDQLEASDAVVISIGANPNFKQDASVIINHLVDVDHRPDVFTWLRTIGDTHGERTRASVANELAEYLKLHPHPSYTELHDVIWGR